MINASSGRQSATTNIVPIRPGPGTAIDPTPSWRQLVPGDDIDARSGAGRREPLPASRWRHDGSAPLEVAHAGNDSHHCIAINLKSTSVTFAHAGRVIVDGRIAVGATQVTAPGVAVRATFSAPCEVLHLHARQGVLAECYEDLFGRAHAGDILLGNPSVTHDPTLERLAQALAVAQDTGTSRLFTDSVGLAIVARLVARHFQSPVTAGRNLTPLSTWRLRRATDYIDAHLSECISLADIAESAGLTRMHFAAQFRRATGLRPHEYLLRRRIEQAQALLEGSAQSILDVALNCGFRSQSHFTTVFKRFVGETPYSWRIKRSTESRAA
ncbi:AraC-type DNA-binding protein [Cupriavidus sp. YR651]|nr:AraC-type DNA-binding protein [Cupriavidus sp. YR651]